jgi:hypothetical protein
MPWHTSGKFAFSPINVTSKKPYRGINTLCLWAAAQRQGYERGEWATYQQWQDRGAQVRKGEKATYIRDGSLFRENSAGKPVEPFVLIGRKPLPSRRCRSREWGMRIGRGKHGCRVQPLSSSFVRAILCSSPSRLFNAGNCTPYPRGNHDP